jgi:site-specific recombinase XerD
MRRKATRRSGNAKRPKTRLGLPDLDHSKMAVLSSLRSPESKRGYRHAIDEFIEWYCSEPRLSFNKVVVTRYRIHLEDRSLAAGTINGRLAAVRRLAYEAADAGLLSPELAAGIRRVKSVKKLGLRLGNWLTVDEARRLLRSPESDTLKGKRDRAILAVLLGCGLRRRELADLEFSHLQRREEHWAIVDLVGKGGHIRTVPVPDWSRLP